MHCIVIVDDAAKIFPTFYKLACVSYAIPGIAPVALIPDQVPSTCRRVLLNRELVGNLDIPDAVDGTESPEQTSSSSSRDLFHPGDCDESIQGICRALGWEEELLQQNEETRRMIQGTNKTQQQ